LWAISILNSLGIGLEVTANGEMGRSTEGLVVGVDEDEDGEEEERRVFSSWTVLVLLLALERMLLVLLRWREPSSGRGSAIVWVCAWV